MVNTFESVHSEGEYQLWVKTADDSSAANGGKVSIAVYGSKGSSKDIELFAPSKLSQLFEPGNIDEFEASMTWKMISVLHSSTIS